MLNETSYGTVCKVSTDLIITICKIFSFYTSNINNFSFNTRNINNFSFYISSKNNFSSSINSKNNFNATCSKNDLLQIYCTSFKGIYLTVVKAANLQKLLSECKMINL